MSDYPTPPDLSGQPPPPMTEGAPSTITSTQRRDTTVTIPLNQLRRLKRDSDALLIDRRTGVFSNVAFDREFKRMSSRFRSSKRRSDAFGVINVDIKGFGDVNEQVGQLGGHVVLRDFAQQLKGRVREDKDFVSRDGGDEFRLLIAVPDRARLKKVAGTLAQPYLVQYSGYRFTLHLYVAAAMVQKAGDDANVLKRVDRQLALLKKATKRA